MTTVAECEKAMKNAAVGDDALVRMFRSCINSDGLVEMALLCNDERAVRLLIAAGFNLNLVRTFVGNSLHCAYHYASQRIIDMLVAAGVRDNNDVDVPSWHFAAQNKDETVMAHLIAAGVDVNAADSAGTTLVHRACKRQDGAVLAMLIAAGAVVNTLDDAGDTALHFACQSVRNPEVLAQLIDLCDVNAENNAGKTPCWCAAMSRNGLALSMLISAGADVHAEDDGGWSAAKVVLRRGDVALLEILIDAGVNMNIVDPKDGTTPMHAAAMCGSHRLLHKLITAGADVNSTNNRKQTPMHVLRDRTNPGDAKLSAIVLLAAKADVNALDEDGNTPLHAAARAGLHDCVSLLIETGAVVEARNRGGRTPLMYACVGETAGFVAVTVLIAAGVDVCAKASAGETALHFAAKSGSSDVISVLIDAKVDVNATTDAGDSAGHWAARTGRVDNLKLLLEHGAQVEHRNKAGKTMLYEAAGAATHAVESMRLLIDAGADVRVIDDAVAHGANATVFPLLRSLGVNLNAVDDRGNTPFHSARDVAAMEALFAHGAATVAKNNANLTPIETFSHGAGIARLYECRCALFMVAAAGLGFDLVVPADLRRAPEDFVRDLDETVRIGRCCDTTSVNEGRFVGVRFRRSKRSCFVRARFRCVSDCSHCA
jgi:ankyrin repeat protein